MNSVSRIPRLKLVETPTSVPQYEVRVRNHGPSDMEIEVWEMPSPASPRLTSAVRVAGLRGRLGMAMHRKNPRRVLTALRYLLTDPTHKH
jgi:hypothetical protein